MALHLGDAFLRILVQMDDLVKGMGQAKSITEQATTEMGQQWEHFFGTLEGGHAQAAQATEQATEGMQTNWLGVAAVYASVAAAGTMLIKNIAGVAMRTQELGIVSEITAKNMGIGKEVVDGQIEALKNLGLTTQAASTLTTQFMRSELELADASKLARAAQNLAIVAMQDSSQAAMTMTRAITMQRPILLRQYGIIGGLTDAHDAMGKSLGILSFKVDSSGKSMRVWSRELTVAEKRQSILNMIMEQSSGLAGAYEAAMDAPGKAMRSFSRHIMSAQEAIGQYWLPAMDKAVKIATMFIKAFVNAPEIVHQLAGALLIGVTAVTAMTAAIILKTIAAQSMIGTVLAAQVTIAGFTMTLAAATLGLSLIIAAIVMLGIKLHEHNKAMQTARQEAFESSDTYAEYAQKMEAAGATAHALSEEIWELAKAERDAAQAQEILIDSANYGAYIQAMKDAGISAKILTEAIWETTRAQIEAEGITTKTIIDIEKEAQARKDLIDELARHKGGLDELVTTGSAMAGLAKQNYEARGEEIKQLILLDAELREVALAQGLVTQAEVDAAESLETLTRASMEHEARRLEGIKSVQAAEQTAAEWMQENIARAIERQKKVQEAYQESLVVITKAIKDMGNVTGEGYAKLAALAEGYQDTVIQLDTEIAIQRVQIAESSARALEQIELTYQTTIRQLRSSERTEELAQITQTSGMVLSLLESSYRSQIAAVEAATREELASVERANADRRIAAAKAYQAELADLQKFIGDKLRMWLELHKEELQGLDVYDKMQEAVQKSFGGQLSIADQFTVKYRELMTAMAEGNTEAIESITADIEGLALAIKEETMAAAEDIKTAQGEINETFETGWAEIHTFVAGALSSLAEITQDYQNKILETWDSYNANVASAAFERNKSLREGEINYQRSRQELIAKANAEINALEAAGLDEKAATRKEKLDEELTMLEYNYETQKAWAKWNWDIQQLMQEKAHYLRLAETAEFAMNETKLLQEQAQAKLNGMTAALHAASGYAHKMLQIDGIIVKSAVTSAQSQIEAIQAVITAHKEAATSYEADMQDNLAEVARLGDEIDALVMEGPQLPEIPDFSQWVGDFSTGMAKSGGGMGKAAKETAVSVTKTLKEAIVDIADGFSAAMEIFTEVAEYETPVGLAEGMQMLREDIEEAVKQMYIAYQALGEEGVTGAKLIAESADEVIKTLGTAVEVFTEGVAGYEGIMPSAIDALISDIEYVLIAVRTKLLDLWGWGGEFKDTVWGHFVSWSESVSAVLGIVEQAVMTFTLLKDYTGIMPGIINLLVDDIKLVLDTIDEVFEDFAGEKPDNLKTVWMQFAAVLIDLIASMIEDLEKIAAFRGELVINQDAVINLVESMETISKLIIVALGDVTGRFDVAGDVVFGLQASWIEFAAGLISTVIGMIDDLITLAGFEGNLTVNHDAVVNLIEVMEQLSKYIIMSIGSVSDRFDTEDRVIYELQAKWIEFSAGLISLVVGMIDDLETLAAYQGDLTINWVALWNLVIQIDTMVKFILGTIGDITKFFDGDAIKAIFAMQAAWLEFAADLISTLSGIIEDLETLNAFEGLLFTNWVSLFDLILTLKTVTAFVLGAIGDVTKYFAGTAIKNVYALQLAWLNFSAGLISTLVGVIEDLETLAAFEGDLEVSEAAITNLISEINKTVNTIITQIGELVTDLETDIWVDRAEVAWAEFAVGLISLFAGVIDDIEKLNKYKGTGIDVGMIGALVHRLSAAVTVIIDTIAEFVPDLEDTSWIDRSEIAWAEFATGLISLFANAVEDFKTLADYTGFGIDVGAIGALVHRLDSAVDTIIGTIAEFVPDLEDTSWVDRAEIAWAEFSTGLVALFASVIEDIEAISAFEEVNEIAFGISLTNLFDALGWFLDEFNLRAGIFEEQADETAAETAELMGRIVGALGGTIQPILDVATFAISQTDAETAIGLFFDALEEFLRIFDEKATDFDAKVDEDIADLATVIGDVVLGIGAAVDPLVKIIEYNPEVTNLEATFNKFFSHLDAVLLKIEEEKNDWVVSDAAIDLTDRVAEVMGHLKSAVDSLAGLADYATQEGSPVSGFVSFDRDLEWIMSLMELASTRITGALPSAEQFATDSITAVDYIYSGIAALNSLELLAAPPYGLVKAGKDLMASLVDGFVQQARNEWVRALTALSGIITEILRAVESPILGLIYNAGKSLGVNFIQGWIDGLNSQIGALYNTITNIVNEAIAAAEIAAGVHSRSTFMYNIGMNLGLGLVEGFKATRLAFYEALDEFARQLDTFLSVTTDRIAEESAKQIDFLTGLPTEKITKESVAFADSMLKSWEEMYGNQWGSEWEGESITDNLWKYFEAVLSAGGDTWNDWITHLPFEMRDLLKEFMEPYKAPPSPRWPDFSEIPQEPRKPFSIWNPNPTNPVTVNVTTLEPAPIAREITFALNRQRLQAELNAGRG